MGVITTHVISHRCSGFGQTGLTASLAYFAIRDRPADQVNRSADFGGKSVSRETVLERFMLATDKWLPSFYNAIISQQNLLGQLSKIKEEKHQQCNKAMLS